MSKAAILIDTISIQQYVFASNKLKDIVGGSLVVAKHYQKILKSIAVKNTEDQQPFQANDKVLVCLHNNEMLTTTIAYIGGGNMMLLLEQNNHTLNSIHAFNYTFSIKAMELYPGLRLAFGFLENFDENLYQESMLQLHASLSKHKQLVYPQTAPLPLGITRNCAFSHLPAAVYNQIYKKYVSLDTDIRQHQSVGEFDFCPPPKGWKFASEFEKLCLTDDNRKIALVHLDGNGMGNKFRECTELKATQDLSAKTASALNEALKKTLEDYVELLGKIQTDDSMGLKTCGNENEPKILPFRPLIAAGDDLTFVCEGRMGIWLTEQILMALHDKFSATAGVLIMNPKTPIYSAYECCEALCKEAKAIAKEEGKSRSMLHFMVAQGNLNQEFVVIKEAYKTGNKSWLAGPYLVKGDKWGSNPCFEKLKQNSKLLMERMPAGKMKELRRMDELDAYELKQLTQDKLPSDLISKERIIGSSSETVIPVYDMQELADFYPFHLNSEPLNSPSS